MRHKSLFRYEEVIVDKGGCFDSNEDEQDLLEFSQIKESMFTI